MKNRLLFIFICLLVSLSLLLTACGGGSTTQATSTTSATTTKTTSTSSTGTTATSSTQTTAITTTSTTATNSLIDILGLGKNISSIKFDLVMTITGQDPITMTVWQKPQKIREDMTMTGITVSILFDMANNVMYTYMPDLSPNTATKTTLNMSMVPESPTKDVSGIMDYSPNITGTETIDGKVCKVIAYNDTGAGSVKMWIWEDQGLPLKMEMIANGTTTTIEYKNIDLSDIPDSIFELPEGVTITES